MWDPHVVPASREYPVHLIVPGNHGWGLPASSIATEVAKWWFFIHLFLPHLLAGIYSIFPAPLKITVDLWILKNVFYRVVGWLSW